MRERTSQYKDYLQKVRPRKIEYNPSPRPSIQVDEKYSVESRPFCTSPTPYSKPNIGNLLQKYSVDGDLIQENFVPKKRAPRPPSSDLTKESSSWAKKSPAPPIPSNRKSDPIREMEFIGKKEVDDVMILM